MEGTTVDVSMSLDFRTTALDSLSHSLKKHACIQNSIVGKHCKIGPWGRVDGEPENPADPKKQLNITILGKPCWGRWTATFTNMSRS